MDEFHERTIEMDLALGMLLRIRQTLRPDLRIIVMSATLAAEPVASLMGNCPVIHAEGRPFPVQVRYQRRGEQRPLHDLVVALVPEALRETSGHVLVFLPGVGEILRCQNALVPLAERHGHALLPLFGDLPAEQQDRVLADFGRRKIILSTNVAETSLTIDGVTAVIDSGQARQMRVSPATGLPRLELVPVSQASAEQAQRGVPAAQRRASVGGSGTNRRTGRGRRLKLPKCCAADLAAPTVATARTGRTGRLFLAGFAAAGSGRERARLFCLLCATNERTKSHRWERNCAVAGSSPFGSAAPGRSPAWRAA